MGDPSDWKIMRTRAGCFLLCPVIDGDGKRHRLFFPKGRGLIKGWKLLGEKLKDLGIKGKTAGRVEKKGNGGPRRSKRETFVFSEGSGRSKTHSNCAWVNVGDCMPKGYLGDLKFCLVEWWKTPLDPFPTALEMEEWVRVTWHLKGSFMVASLNKDLLFMEFADPEDAKWVLVVG